MSNMNYELGCTHRLCLAVCTNPILKIVIQKKSEKQACRENNNHRNENKRKQQPML